VRSISSSYSSRARRRSPPIVQEVPVVVGISDPRPERDGLPQLVLDFTPFLLGDICRSQKVMGHGATLGVETHRLAKMEDRRIESPRSK
jgi:hypothetical protein